MTVVVVVVVVVVVLRVLSGAILEVRSLATETDRRGRQRSITSPSPVAENH